jgi:hypothetical protein
MRSNIDLGNSENIKTESDEEIRLLLCSICYNVLMRPLVCDSCQIASCEECLTFWNKKTKKCPSGCNKYKYTKPSKFLHEHLKNLTIKCENHDEGCDEMVKYEDIEKHQSQCEHSTVHCQHGGCDKVSNRGEMNQHDRKCDFKRSMCDSCHETILVNASTDHNCSTVLNAKIKSLEAIVKEFITKMEDAPSDDDDHDEDQAQVAAFITPSSVRHEYIQDYLLEFSIYHQSSNHYQITLPHYAMPVSPNARSVFLRVVVHDCSVAKLFTRCTIRQTGVESGVNLSNYIIPTSGAPTIFEVVLPWTGSGVQQIGIEWEKSMHAHNLSTSTLSAGSHSMHTTLAIPAHASEQALVSPGQAMLSPGTSVSSDLTHGVIYIGISGYME